MSLQTQVPESRIPRRNYLRQPQLCCCRQVTLRYGERFQLNKRRTPISLEALVERVDCSRPTVFRAPSARHQPALLERTWRRLIEGTINVPSWSPDGKMLAFISNTYELTK